MPEAKTLPVLTPVAQMQPIFVASYAQEHENGERWLADDVHSVILLAIDAGSTRIQISLEHIGADFLLQIHANNVAVGTG